MSAFLWVISRILIFCWIYIAGCYTQNDTLGLAVVEDNLPATQEESPSMPSNLNMTINLFQNNTNAVDLKLGMNKAMNEQRSVYVIRTNRIGQPVLRKQQIPIEANIAFYQDKSTGANVMVTCDGFETGHCDPSLEGSFYLNNVEYGLEPIQADSPVRHKRSLTRNGRRGKLYSVFKRHQEPTVKNDFDSNPVSREANTGQSMQLVDRVLDLSEFMSPTSATMEMRRRISDTNTKSRHRKERKKPDISTKPFEMGLVVIVDFSIYQSWYRKSDQVTPIEKDIDTKSKIRQYMAHVINGVDLRFQNLRNMRIKVVVSRYIIADTPIASPWTSRRFLAHPRDLVYADDALNELIKWRYRMGHDLPRHDHTILFTGYDLYRPTLANKGVAGFARVNSMCSHSSVSVVEEHGGFGSILTATHEIGHSLGAYHDGHNNTCSGEDNFIMTPIGGSATPSNALNPFHFSECSEEAFQKLIDSFPVDHCLTDETDMYDAEEFVDYIKQKAGQLYGPNNQCRQHLGSASYYAWGGILGEASEVCTHMACKNSMSNTSFNIYYAARGTSCGNKKWCVDGECLYADKAPKRDDSCVHGDAWRMFGDKSCAQYVKEDPSRCYFSYYSRFCCVSCGKLRTNEPGCEYGDRKKKVCNIVQKEARFCYHNNNEKMCCGSCKKQNTGIKGCEYGDRLPDCKLHKCADEETYAKQCCKTCRNVKMKPKLIVPPAPYEETLSTTISKGPKPNSKHANGSPSSTNIFKLISTNSNITSIVPPPTEQRKQNNNSETGHRKVEGIKVSKAGPIATTKPSIGTLNKPLIGQNLHSGSKQSHSWKSRKPLQPKLSEMSTSHFAAETLMNTDSNSVPLFRNDATNSGNFEANTTINATPQTQDTLAKVQDKTGKTPDNGGLKSSNMLERASPSLTSPFKRQPEAIPQDKPTQKRQNQLQMQRQHESQQQREQQRGQDKRQTQTEREQEAKRKHQLELQRQREQELQRQREQELQQHREQEFQRQREIELQRKREQDLQRKREQELQQQREEESQRQREQELQQQRQQELQRQREQEIQQQRQQEQQRQREHELQRQREQAVQFQREQALQRQREQALQRQRQEALKRQHEQARHAQRQQALQHQRQQALRRQRQRHHERRLPQRQQLGHRRQPRRQFRMNRFSVQESRPTKVLNRLRSNLIPKWTVQSTTTTTTPAPVIFHTNTMNMLFDSFRPPERCLKPGATIMTMRCEWIAKLMAGVCTNALLGGYCCEDCSKLQAQEPVCVDNQDCAVRHREHCYDDTLRSSCCATCKSYKTQYPDCEYGDREKHCNLFMHYMPEYTCNAFKRNCCLSCRSRVPTTTAPPLNIATTDGWTGNSWDNRRQSDRVNNNLLPWNN